MEKHLPRDVRNIAVAGHIGGGKTSLIEAILHCAGAVDRRGRIEEGTTACDWDPDEIRRGHSIQLALAPCDWAGRELHWVDTPGHPDFAFDVTAALRVVDDVLLVTPAQNSGGLEYGMETCWELARAAGKAEAVFVSKMDKENADFYGAVDALRERFGPHVVPAVLPIGAGASFQGVVDLIRQVAVYAGGREGEIPAECRDDAQTWRARLIEVAAEGDDALIEKYLEGDDLSEEEVERGIHADLLSGNIIPVFCGSSVNCIGVEPLLNHLALEFQSPDEAPVATGVDPRTGAEVQRACDPAAPLSALVFKTIADPYVGKITLMRIKSGTLRGDAHLWNSTREREERVGTLFLLRGKRQLPIAEAVAGDLVAVAKLTATRTGDTLCDRTAPIVYPGIEPPVPTYSLAAYAKSKVDEDKLSTALHRVEEEDPAFQHRRDPATGETVLMGQGETHLEVVVGRLGRFGSNVTTTLPKVPYRETLLGRARAQGRHKKQSGGRGQFGDCWLQVEPLPSGSGFEFVDKIVGGAIPRQYLPAVERGVREAMARGVLSGHPLVDVRVTCDDGSFHTVDSSEAAFVQAGILGFAAAARQADPTILEPVLWVSVVAPEAVTGELMGDFNGRRGHVLGISPAERPGYQTIEAHVPLSKMLRYAVELRALARGRGAFCSRLSHYAPLSPTEAAPLIAEYERRRAEGNHDGPGR